MLSAHINSIKLCTVNMNWGKLTRVCMYLYDMIHLVNLYSKLAQVWILETFQQVWILLENNSKRFEFVFENFIELFFDTVFVHFFDFDLKMSLNSPLKNIWKRVSKIVWNLFENLQNVFKTFQNISKSCLKNFKHWEVNNLQLLDQLTIVRTS